MYPLNIMKPLVQKQLSRYVRENSSIESNDTNFVCKSCHGKGITKFSRYIAKDGLSFKCTQCSSSGDIFVLFQDYEGGNLSNEKICEILIKRYNLEKELSKEYFDLTDAKHLYNDNFEELKFIVSSLLPQGLSILAGSPKIGKSWFVLWLCVQIANGDNVWKYQTIKGTTLYLSLEDNLRRLQNRLIKITDNPPENMYIATMANTINDGLDNQIKSFITEHNDTNLIVIDTLQRIREPQNSGNVYGSDYCDIARLKAIADKYDIAILLVHHMRKMPDNDPFNMFSGTNGILGAVDCAMALVRESRFDNKANLYITSRDDSEKQLLLGFEDFKWSLISNDASEYEQYKLFETSPVVSAIIKFAEHKKIWVGTASELLELLKQYSDNLPVQANKLSQEINQYKEQMLQENILIENKVVTGKRLIKLSLLSAPSLESSLSEGTDKRIQNDENDKTMKKVVKVI